MTEDKWGVRMNFIASLLIYLKLNANTDSDESKII